MVATAPREILRQVAPAGPPARVAKRIGFLEGVRGLAAAMVVVQHLVERLSPAYLDWSMRYANLGRAGVVAFFLVSGYVIALSLEHQSLRAFVVRRFFRLYPVYWVAMAFVMVVLAVTPGKTMSASPAEIVINVTMVQGLIGVICILPPAWTLGIELLFYVQSATAAAFRRLSAAVHLGWLWLFVYVGASIAVWRFGIDLPTTLPLLLFTASVGHALYLKDSAGGRDWIPLCLAGLTVVPLAAFPALAIDAPGDIIWHPVSYGFSCVVGGVLFAAFYLLKGLRTGRVLTWFGAISYSLYLFHSPVLTLADGWLDGIVFAVAGVGLSLVIAQLTYRWIERPSIAAGRRFSA